MEEFGKLLLDLENMTRQLAKQEHVEEENIHRGETTLLRENGAGEGTAAPPGFSGLAAVERAPVINAPAASMPVSNMPEAAPAAQGGKTSGKNISLLYLMQHYNKENASEYKAQKAAKKQAEKDEKEKKKQDKKQQKQEKKEKKGKTKKREAKPGGMAVPVPAPSDSAQKMTAAPPAGAADPKPMAIGNMPAYKGTAFGGGGHANFGETTVLSSPSASETTVLTGMTRESVLQPYLFRQKSGEKIALNRPVFRIGKEPSFVDYLISDNAAVSRSHANFIVKDGACRVVDTNSTNHTYVNGAMIPSNVETALKDGDLVRLANEEFQFRMM